MFAPSRSLNADQKLAQRTFLDAYQGEILGPSKIRLVIPPNSTFLTLLQGAQALAPTLYKLDAVWPSRLEKWAALSAFNESRKNETTLTIDGVFAGSEWKTRLEQEKFIHDQGRRLGSLPKVAAAHGVYFIATGTDFFNGRIVRVQEPSSLYYGDGGLSLMNEGDFIDTCRYQHVVAAVEL
jgi:hypothetical protein